MRTSRERYSIRHKHVQSLATKIYDFSLNLSPTIIIFKVNQTIPYDLRERKWKPYCPCKLFKVCLHHAGFIWKLSIYFYYNCYHYWEFSCLIHARVTSVLNITLLNKTRIDVIYMFLHQLLIPRFINRYVSCMLADIY